MENNTPARPCPILARLDAVIWDAETWVAEFNALLDAIELQFAIDVELSDSSMPER